MTPVNFHFLAPNGVPLADAIVEIQLSKAGYDDEVDGVVVPRLVTAVTDEFGQVTVPLQPSTTLYYVTVEDTASEAAVFYKFYVPVLTDEDASVRLQDIIVDATMSGTTYDEAALLVIHDAKANAITASQAAQLSEQNAKASEDNAKLSELAASDSAESVLGSETRANDAADNALAAQVAAETSAGEAAVSAGNADASAIAAAASAGDAWTANASAETAAGNAAVQAGLAQDAAVLASTKADDASAFATAASTSADSAADIYADTAQVLVDATTQAGIAQTQAGIAQTKVEEADDAALLAKDWATKPVVEVVAGQGYSAKEYAQQAAASAASAANAAVGATSGQVNADWSETDPSIKSYIINKPVLAAVALTGNKADVGLGNVNNTSDVNKPVSTATQAVACAR
jgi:hypothetical protein